MRSEVDNNNWAKRSWKLERRFFGNISRCCLRMIDEFTKEEYARIKAQVDSMEEKHFCPACWTILWMGFEAQIKWNFIMKKINPNKELLNTRYDNSLQGVSVHSSGENLPRFGLEFLGSDHQLSEQLFQKERRRQSRTGNVAFMLKMRPHVRLAKGCCYWMNTVIWL